MQAIPCRVANSAQLARLCYERVPSTGRRRCAYRRTRHAEPGGGSILRPGNMAGLHLRRAALGMRHECAARWHGTALRDDKRGRRAPRCGPFCAFPSNLDCGCLCKSGAGFELRARRSTNRLGAGHCILGRRRAMAGAARGCDDQGDAYCMRSTAKAMDRPVGATGLYRAGRGNGTRAGPICTMVLDEHRLIHVVSFQPSGTCCHTYPVIDGAVEPREGPASLAGSR